jgi:hypothetical protein
VREGRDAAEGDRAPAQGGGRGGLKRLVAGSEIGKDVEEVLGERLVARAVGGLRNQLRAKGEESGADEIARTISPQILEVDTDLSLCILHQKS